MSGGYLLVPLTVASALLCGILLALFNSIRAPLAGRLGVGESQVDLLGLLQQATLLLFLPLAGIVVDVLGIEYALVGGSLLAAFAVALLALRSNFTPAGGIAVALGAATAGLAASTTVLMTKAFFAEPARPAAAVNLGSVFVILGGVAAAPLADLLLSGLRFRRSLLVLALLALAPAFLATLISAEVLLPEGGRSATPLAVVQLPLLWLAGLIMLLYSPVEAAIPRWAASNLISLGYSPGRATGFLVGFWTCFLLSRVAAAFLLNAGLLHGAEPWAIVILGLLVGVSLGNLAGTGYRQTAALGLLVLGCFCGPIYPTILGTLLGRFPAEAGTTAGCLLAAGTLGSLLIVPLIGYYVRTTSVQYAFRIPLVASLLLAGAALVLGLTF